MSNIFLKLFFPSWRFFDHVEYEIKLEVSFENQQEPQNNCLEKGRLDWQVVSIPCAAPSFGLLFYNPENNLRLQQLSTIEGLAQAAQDRKEVSDSRFLKLYQEVLDILRSRLPQRELHLQKIRFRLVAESLSNPEEKQVLFISEIEELAS